MKNQSMSLYREDWVLVVSGEPVVGSYTTTTTKLEEYQDNPWLAEKDFWAIVDKVSAKAQGILNRRRLLNKK